jgi:plastocyanin
LASVQSPGGLFTFAVIGFVIGVLIAGAIGANVILRNLSSGRADVTILPNAMNLAKAYDPLVFHVAIGGTVIWINKDTTGHTVTSNTTGLFNSGFLDTGATWSHTFSQAGTIRTIAPSIPICGERSSFPRRVGEVAHLPARSALPKSKRGAPR